ncbi:MAG: translation initiation factor [Bacteroidetes bacterium]|nr:translation initiation factor [Bacteroidota bacterium]
MSSSKSLQDLAALLGTPAPSSSEQPASTKKRLGYDGKPMLVKVRKETRRGKTITSITGFQSHPKDLHTMLSTFKSKFGTGGSVLDNAIEIQGDHTTKVIEFLKAEGYSVKG